MFKNLRFEVKMFGGFSVILALLVLAAAVGYDGVTRLSERVEKNDVLDSILKGVLEARRQEKNFIIRRDDEYIARTVNETERILREAWEAVERFEDADYRQGMDSVIQAIGLYRGSFDALVKSTGEHDAALAVIREKATDAVRQCDFIAAELRKRLKNEGRASTASLVGEIDGVVRFFLEIRNNGKDFISSGGDPKIRVVVEDMLTDLNNRLLELRDHLTNEDDQRRLAPVISAIQEYTKQFKKLAQTFTSRAESDKTMVNAARQAQKICEDMRGVQKDLMFRQMGLSTKMMAYTALAGVALGLLLAWLITRGLTGPIKRIIQSLGAGADQVSAASNQVSSASQSLAEGASEQASALEQTSASLEEMTSMTTKTAQNAAQADSLMVETGQAVESADRSMEQMAGAMDEISHSGREIEKIIKTIDEIAFQTNLLALNAAVEAARAGEAGAGFAVVADEVRNLAQRAADAAKDTSDLISGTIKRISQGAQYLGQVNDKFKEIDGNARRVAVLIQDIASGSKEQALGIEQINQAVSQMDSVTQKNAAGAEETAAASEELNAQAESMLDVVDDLTLVIMGKNGLVHFRTAETHPAHHGPKPPAALTWRDNS